MGVSVNRSWLQFNGRLLELAEDESLSPFERLRFLWFAQKNLDEFFGVRIGKALANGDRVRLDVSGVVARVEAVWQELYESLVAGGVLVEGAAVGEEEPERISGTWLGVDDVEALRLHLYVRTKRGDYIVTPERGGRLRRVGEAWTLRETVEDASGLEDVVGAWAFRVTRSLETDVDADEAGTGTEALERELRRRRNASVTRLQVERGMPEDVLGLLVDDLGPAHVVEEWRVLEPEMLMNLSSIGVDILGSVRDVVGYAGNVWNEVGVHDVVLQTPRVSWFDTVGAFVKEGCDDPDVDFIGMTLYRVKEDGEIVRALCRAAERGAKAVVYVEVQARLDEVSNLRTVRKLREAGCVVVTECAAGKVHAKVFVAEVRGELRGYRTHLGTGNYNETTADAYEDVHLFTADRFVGRAVKRFFKSLEEGVVPWFGGRWAQVVVPDREWFVKKIREQASYGPRGSIRFKVNNLTDVVIVQELEKAAEAGVVIRGLVRSLCTASPPQAGERGRGYSIESILGKELEHSRVFLFGAHPDYRGTEEAWAGSCDWMPRNLDRRVECVFRVPVEFASRVLNVGDRMARFELCGSEWKRSRT